MIKGANGSFTTNLNSGCSDVGIKKKSKLPQLSLSVCTSFNVRLKNVGWTDHFSSLKVSLKSGWCQVLPFFSELWQSFAVSWGDVEIAEWLQTTDKGRICAS